ncbi:MAG: hypothetical protein KatS3mg121_0495 [Gammaproteobacteria bacterium]|nr:MAG: hypothetical protein KatS3mg121_0495 [Gammaproteobacteria bacterium]
MTQYAWEDRSVESNYVADALVRLTGANDVVVLATEAALHAHEQSLREALRETAAQVSFMRIPEAPGREPWWQLFRSLSKALQDTDAALIDITHGFRALPFFAGAVVMYTRFVKRASLETRIVYGAFEAREEDGTTPIWDLTAFVDLIDWTHAIDAFLSSGKSAELATRAQNIGRRLSQEWARTKQGDQPRLPRLAQALTRFSDALTTVRTGELLLGSRKHPSAVVALLDALEQSHAEITAYLPPLAEILDRIRAMLRPLRVEEDHLSGAAGRNHMVALSRLYMQLDRHAEAMVTLREAWVNLFAPPAATRPGPELDLHARDRAERRARRATERGASPFGLRNDLQHGGFRKNPLPPKAIRGQLAQAIDRLEREPPPEDSDDAGRIWFVTRHPGAADWLRRKGVRADVIRPHLDPCDIQEGDLVVGNLPLHIVAEVCRRGGRFFNLSIDIPPELRGAELMPDDLERVGARLEEYRVERIDSEPLFCG